MLLPTWEELLVESLQPLTHFRQERIEVESSFIHLCSRSGIPPGLKKSSPLESDLCIIPVADSRHLR